MLCWSSTWATRARASTTLRTLTLMIYDGNVAPVGFYQQNWMSINVDNFKRKNYSKGTMKLITNAENYWRTYVPCSLYVVDRLELTSRVGTARRLCVARTG